MRLLNLLLSAAAFVLAAPVFAAAPPPAATAAPARVVPAPAQIRLEMRLSRTDKEGRPGTENGGDKNGDKKAAFSAPPAIGTPTLTTLDRGTATVSVTNNDLGYTISASPSLEQAGNSRSTVQVLWNVRLSGRTLPGGTNAVTTTGATRIAPESKNETLLTELPITDAKTGHISVFRLTVHVVVTPVTSPGPEVGPVPPTPPSAS